MKKVILWLAAAALVMLGLPWLAVTFVQGDAGMAVCFLLFFAADPVWSIALGVFSGKDIRSRWALPIVSAALFLAGTWLLFDRGETAFVLYAGIYLALGTAAMLITARIRKE